MNEIQTGIGAGGSFREQGATFAARLFDALTDPARQDRTVLGLIAGYVVAWTLYGVVQKSSQDISPDMAELFVWSRHLALGYWKHPPFGVYVVKAWTMVFPAEDWSFYLLAMTNVGAALWIAWRVSAAYLTQEKRIVGLAFLTLVPFFNFRALVYDHNSLLMPLWALTTMYFLRSFETQRVRDAVLAGLFAGIAMLGKYWTVDLLAALALAAILDSRRKAYFFSAAPVITTVVGAIVLAPNLVWQYVHHYPSFTYAVGKHPGEGILAGLMSSLKSLSILFLNVVIPVALTAVSVSPSKVVFYDTFLPKGDHRRLISTIFWTPLILPALLSATGGFPFGSLWSMPAFTLFPATLLGSPFLRLTRAVSIRILAIALIFPLLALLAAPIVSLTILWGPVRENSNSRALSGEVQRFWRGMTDEPLELVIGSHGLAIGVAFYSPDHPEANPRAISSPWSGAYPPILLDPEQLKQKGAILVCEGDEADCFRTASQMPSPFRLHSLQIVLRRHFMGMEGQSEKYFVFAAPPT